MSLVPGSSGSRSGSGSSGAAGAAGSGLGSANTTGFRLGMRPAFDGLRGAALLLVLGWHATYFVVTQYAGRFIPGGFIAVDMFFVLSGFLITSLLIEECDRSGAISFRTFYTRRVRRLLPALIVMLTAYVLWAWAVGAPMRAQIPIVAVILCFAANLAPLFHVAIPFHLGNTWTLGIEEQYYLLWPALLFVLLRLRPRTRRTLWILAMALCLVASLVGYQLHPSVAGFTERITRVNGLIVGSGLAYIMHRGWRPPRWSQLAAVPATAFLVLVIMFTHDSDQWTMDGGFTVIVLAIAVVLVNLIDNRTVLARLLSWRPLRYVGEISYSGYLWHMFLFLALLRAWPGSNTPERLGGCFGLLAVVSVASRHLVELPFTRRRRGSRAGQAAPVRARTVPAGPAGAAAGAPPGPPRPRR